MKNNSQIPGPATACSCSLGCCGIERRDFLKLAALGAAAGLGPTMPVMAGPFESSDFEKLVPADKKLDPAWVQSLTARGTRTVYRGTELAKIGMPVGGICAGQVYLGGDGKLWHWDIFNQHIATGDAHYAKPPAPSSPLEQGFGIGITVGGKRVFRALDHTGFSDIAFRGEYPIGSVEYRDPTLPVAVSLEAFSPFIPHNSADSSMPATIMRFSVTNTGGEKIDVDLVGWLQNAVCLHTGKSVAGQRQNRILRQPTAVFLDGTVVAAPGTKLDDKPDFGTMGLALLEPQASDVAAATIPEGKPPHGPLAAVAEVSAPMDKTLVGGLVRKLSLAPGQSATATFVISWHFPNLKLKDGGRFYATRFKSAAEVAGYVAGNFDRLYRQTRLWRDTWYDSTLPYWFLDRTFANTSILATATCHRFANGRFYGWEGVGCCEGTCTHVWHYAHAVARLFPDLERDLRRRTDFGTALDTKSGVINHRGEGHGLAVDGQAGCILRAYREHQMSADDAFLRAIWPKVKLAMQCLLKMDDGAGVLQGAQHNTLDQPWFGKIAWLSSLYVAAAQACEEMAKDMGDQPFAAQMRQIAERGGKSIDGELFNGEYYIQLADKKAKKSVGSYNGCEIDQAFGQSWAYQVGLGRILNEANVKKALESLWKYNFTPDVGPFRARNKPGRWYALAGEAGLLMCSWPRGDAARVQQGFDFYFNECMTGFEYQAAGHMIWEGLVQEGLAVTRAVHDRYHAARRNPWNEVECGDHYARAMASYGVFLAACGYEYHGPKGYLAFAPRLSPEKFRAAFTTAAGWGTFAQHREAGTQHASLELKAGMLALRRLALSLADQARPKNVHVTLNGDEVACKHAAEKGRVVIDLAEEITVQAGQTIHIAIG